MSMQPDVMRERDSALRVVTIPYYDHSRAALGRTPEIDLIASALENAAARRPRAGVLIPGTIVHVLHSGRYGAFPPLRLFYSVVGGNVHLLAIEQYDEMEP